MIRPGGAAFIVDNDLRSGTFAAWLRRLPDWAQRDPDTVEHFWSDHGFTLTRIPSVWQFERRADLETVVRNEFRGGVAEQLLAEHEGLSVEYHYALYHRRY